MAFFIQAILDCVNGREDQKLHQTSHGSITFTSAEDEKEERLATDIVNILYTSEKAGEDLKNKLDQHVHISTWRESLAKRVLNGLIAALESGRAMSGSMKEAYEKSVKEANRFAHERSVLTAAIVTVIAIGILVLLSPYVVEILGFTARGPAARSFAAWWQSTFPDVEAGSFFASLQRLGMKWGKK